jgi:hypothetical protein
VRLYAIKIEDGTIRFTDLTSKKWLIKYEIDGGNKLGKKFDKP